MARKMKGGAGEGGMVFVWGIVLIVLVVVAVVALTSKAKFVSGPSASGDKQEVTPAGNVILY